MNSTVKTLQAGLPLPGKNIDSLIQTALVEDIGRGDVTTDSIIPETMQNRAIWRAKQDGVIAGLFMGEKVFRSLNSTIKWQSRVDEGRAVKKGTVLATIEGQTRALLTGERTALNFVQRMCGIATKTTKFAKRLEGTNTRILDTRKTLPGFRMLDKYAVKAGGGENHRMGLFDMALIKENHITAAGSILKALECIQEANNDVKIEVEAINLQQVKEALKARADMIMFDNMSNEEMEKAVALINGQAKTEASGNITLERFEEVAECGVDYISVGALTHSVEAFDISQIIE